MTGSPPLHDRTVLEFLSRRPKETFKLYCGNSLRVGSYRREEAPAAVIVP